MINSELVAQLLTMDPNADVFVWGIDPSTENEEGQMYSLGGDQIEIDYVLEGDEPPRIEIYAAQQAEI